MVPGLNVMRRDVVLAQGLQDDLEHVPYKSRITLQKTLIISVYNIVFLEVAILTYKYIKYTEI